MTNIDLLIVLRIVNWHCGTAYVEVDKCSESLCLRVAKYINFNVCVKGM